MSLEVKKTNIRAWSMLGQRGTVFSRVMPELAANDENIRLLTADLSLLSSMDRFIRDYPEQFLNVGIAEQNMIGIAAGMAMEGRRVFATTYSSFIAVRALEHVRQHLGHLRCDVKLIGTSGGVVASKSGISHWATEDIAFIRAIDGIEIYSPADALEAVKVMQYAATHEGPMYIRLTGSTDCPVVFKEDYDWQRGKNVVIREGDRTAILATGMMVKRALDAASILSEQGIEAEVADICSIKPLDEEYLKGLSGRFDRVFTIEEHSIMGGLGGAVAEVLSGLDGAPRLTRIGIEGYMDKLGNYDYVLEQQGLTAEAIAKRVSDELG